MTTRDAWPQAQARMSETVHWEAGLQSRQHMQAGTASMHCNQNTYADRHTGDTSEGRGGRVDAQDMSEQGCTGDWKRVHQPERVAVGRRPASGRLST